MATTSEIIRIGLLLSFVPITWLSSQRYGVLGLIAAEQFVLFGYLAIAGIAIGDGSYEYDGFDSGSDC